MGAFEKLFGKFKQKKEINRYFEMLNGYTPIFTTHDGGVYEMELTRSCIHAFANHCSKLSPTVSGADLRGLKGILDNKPNPYHVTSQFLYKAASIYDAQNTCYLTPILDDLGKTIGFYPVIPQQSEIKEYQGIPYLVFTFGRGKKAAIECDRVGIISKYLYSNDFHGEDNRVLRQTMQLIEIQNQGIEHGIKNGASFRFMANVNNFAKGKDIKKERESFVNDNLGPDSGGLALFPNTYTNVQQIQSHPNIVDPEQMKIIQTRVYNYFGSNESILQNTAVGDVWDAFYEGKIEPFTIQLSQVMTAMAYTRQEIERGNKIVWSANRLQYMANRDKLSVSSQMFDRGIMSINDIMDIWNMPHVENGDKRYIRKEYTEIEKLNKDIKNENEGEENGNAE